MRLLLLVFLTAQSLWTTALAQDDFTEIHKEDFARWFGFTSLTPSDIHKMWRSTSHYANEGDDDSSIELLDTKSLGSRRQILMVTSAGIPKCVTVAIFSTELGHRKLWQQDQGPDDYGFCDNLGIPVRVSVSLDRLIQVTTVVYRDEDDSSRVVVREYSYVVYGDSHRWSRSRDSLKPLPRGVRR
jgi:hypothetical protein